MTHGRNAYQRTRISWLILTILAFAGVRVWADWGTKRG